MTIHFFTKGNKNIASSRQRAFLVAEELDLKGMSVIVHTPPINKISETSWPYKMKLIFASYRNLWKVRRGDIIFLQRAIQNKYFFLGLIVDKLFFRHKIIFDIDDAVYIHSPLKTKISVYLADAVLVGSHSIMNWVRKYNKNVYLIPTCVDTLTYEKFGSKCQPNKQFTIGWIGNGPAHYENLKILVPILKDIANKKSGILFQLVGSLGDEKIYTLFRNIDNLQVEFIDALDWGDKEIVPHTISGFDIGLMPLTDSEWNKGKCAFKAIEYMACGVVTLASPVGENQYLIENGKNGFLPKSEEDWTRIIIDIYENKSYSYKISLAATDTIRDKYSLHIVSQEISKVINKLSI